MLMTEILEPESLLPTDGPPARGRRGILVVEDDDVIRTLITEVLCDAGHQATAVIDGAEALRTIEQARAAQEPFGAILLDLMLPQVNGLALLRQLRVFDTVTPVVAMSASDYLLGQAVAAGAQCALAKPFDLDRLLMLVEEYCPGRT